MNIHISRNLQYFTGDFLYFQTFVIYKKITTLRYTLFYLFLFFSMTETVVEEEIEKIVEKDSIEKHTKRQKESIFKTIGTTIWL